jgi:DNA modification methylase
LVITDPPYNKGLDYGKKFDDRKPWPEYYAEIKKILFNIPRILSEKGSFYLISYPEINARLLPFLEEELGLNYRRWITWHYPTNIGHSYKNFTRSQRSILFFTKQKNGYIFNRDPYLIQPYKNPTAPVIKERLKNGSKGRTSYDALKLTDLYELNKLAADVQEIDLLKNNSPERLRNLGSKFISFDYDVKKLKKADHPCQLPLSLLELLINVSSQKDSIVFDPFAGTFTTSAAAVRLGRNSIGIELNKKFLRFGVKRLSFL